METRVALLRSLDMSVWVPMRGEVVLDVFDLNRKKVDEILLGDNLLVAGFYTNLSHLVAGDSVGRYVDRMQFGTGSAAAQGTDSTLQVPITPIKTVLVDHPTATTTRFRSYLMETEGNGFPISEAGLLAVDDTLVARKIFAGQVKTSDYIFGFRWTISP